MKTHPVLLIAHAFPPENLIGAYRPGRFARYLPDFGFEPWVMTASDQPSPLPPRLLHVPFSYNLLEIAFAKSFFPHDDRITWAPRALRAASRWLSQIPGKPIIFSTSPPVASHWVAWRLARRFGLPWVADLRDPLVANFGRRTRLGKYPDGWFECQTVQRSDRLIMNTAAAAQELCSRYPEHAHKVSSLPNGYDPADSFGPLPIPPRSCRVWFYGGTIYQNRYAERLLDALWRLVDSGRLALDWQLRFLGLIEDPSLMQRPSALALAERGAINAHFHHVPRAEALREAAEADGTLILDAFHSRSPNLVIPGKSFECVRLGRPILAFTSPDAPLDRLLKLSGVPSSIIYEEDPPTRIEEKLLAYAQLPSTPVSPSTAFELAHSAPHQTRTLAALFQELLPS